MPQNAAEITNPEPENTPRRCPRCRTTLYRTRIGTHEGPSSGWTCWCCGWWDDIPDRIPERRQVVKNQSALVQCSVVGCSRMVQASVTTTGRCTRCNKALADWEASAKTKPAPLVMIAAQWVFNPQRPLPAWLKKYNVSPDNGRKPMEAKRWQKP
jgi:phage FluMu protein Com